MSIPTSFNPLGTLGGGLPHGWREVDAVYFDGATVLDSGVAARTGYKVHMQFELLDLSVDRSVFSYLYGSGNTRVYYGAHSPNSGYYVGRANYYQTQVRISTNELDWVSVLGADDTYGSINGTSYSLGQKGVLDYSPDTLALGGLKLYGSTPTAGIKMNFKRLTVETEDGGHLIADLRAVENANTGEASVFDFVSRSFLQPLIGSVKPVQG